MFVISNAIDRFTNGFNYVLDLLYGLLQFLGGILSFFIFVCKSFINLISRFFSQFWGLDFNEYFTSQFPVLGQYVGRYVNFVVIAVTLIVCLYLYQFLMRRLKGK